jgi:hypothetical protein
MNAIVMNTLTGAVSEYSNFEFQSITPTHAGSDAGLFLLGGDLDVAALIVSTVTTGLTQWSVSLKKFLGLVYFTMIGTGTSTLSVGGYSYTFPVRDSGVSRCKPGSGIRKNLLAFTYSNTDGAQFRLDTIEVVVIESTTRRV